MLVVAHIKLVELLFFIICFFTVRILYEMLYRNTDHFKNNSTEK